MKNNNLETTIENKFKDYVKNNKEIKNAYLLVHSDALNVHMNIAQGTSNGIQSNPNQPNYMASVGKLFTATLVAMLKEEEKLSFDDKVSKFLDKNLLRNLHIFKGSEYTEHLKIKHLLGQTSGLADNFRDLLEQLIHDKDIKYSPIESIEWVKNNTNAHFVPGKGFKYTDTNYHLLGLIIESITKQPFHIALSKYIFEPLGMKNSCMNHYSEPIQKSEYSTADFYYKGIRLNESLGYAMLDFSGGGIVSTTEDLLIFMKALRSYKLLNKNTLEEMMSNTSKLGLGIDYGYGIWKISTVPLLMPKRFNSWGVAGATGSFMFYHPKSDAFVIGNFNDFSQEQKGLRFMLLSVINHLSKQSI